MCRLFGWLFVALSGCGFSRTKTYKSAVGGRQYAIYVYTKSIYSCIYYRYVQIVRGVCKPSTPANQQIHVTRQSQQTNNYM